MNADADQRLAAVPELEWVGNSHDLHHARIPQSLHATTHGRFGESDLFGDGAVGATTVLLQQADDLAIGRVENTWGRVDEFEGRTVLVRFTLSLRFVPWHWLLLPEP